ncbi:MAG: tetratricopeptide repeat protein [Kiritimatiellaeota bacterium]|nr:tetratricopeptide repeat protein [Kiritimatiellota bacterium]
MTVPNENVNDYRKAAEAGDGEAQFALAMQCYEAKKYGEFVKWLRKSAKQGFAPAQDKLGIFYAISSKRKYNPCPQVINISQNYTKAVFWYRKAAKQGYERAIRHLAQLYHDGIGVPQSYIEAAKLYRKGAKLGFPRMQAQLAWYYTMGFGVPRRYAEAAKWYRKAAELGNSYAQYELGQLYVIGRNVPYDLVNAFAWISLAAINDPKNQDAFKFCDILMNTLSRKQIEEGRRLRESFIKKQNA